MVVVSGEEEPCLNKFFADILSAQRFRGVVSSVSARPVIAEVVNDDKAAAGSGCAGEFPGWCGGLRPGQLRDCKRTSPKAGTVDAFGEESRRVQQKPDFPFFIESKCCIP